MAYFGCEITPPPKGSHQRSLSLPSFPKSEYLVNKVQHKTRFDMTPKDISDLKVYPDLGNVKTVSEYLHRTDESMLVLFPAHEKIERSLARYRKSSENLQDEKKSNKALSMRMDRMEMEAKEVRLLLEITFLSSLTFYKLQDDLCTRLGRLENRLRVSDTKRLAAYEGNLVIEMVKRLSDNHDIEAEIKGNDPEACKQKLVGAAETLIKRFGTAKKVNSHDTESEKDVEHNWETATGLLPKYMKAVRTFEKKVEARNILAHKTAGQLAQLLMEAEHFETHNYYYLGGLIMFLYGKTVGEMAREEDAKDAEREMERIQAELQDLETR